MISIDWVVASKGASLDRDSGELSLFGILSDMAPQGLPFVFQQAFIAMSLHRQHGDPEVLTTDFDFSVDGDSFAKQSIRVDFQGAMHSYSIVAVYGFIIPKPGEFKIKVSSPNVSPREFRILVTAPSGATAPVNISQSATGLHNFD